MHPVFQKLLDVKWKLFGKWGTFQFVAINLLYTLIWTVLGILLPREGENYYTPLSSNWWRLLLEIIGVLLTVYFISTVRCRLSLLMVMCVSFIVICIYIYLYAVIPLVFPHSLISRLSKVFNPNLSVKHKKIYDQI